MQPPAEDEGKLTVGEGDDLAGPFGLGHSPDILYRVGLALAGFSTEVVGEVAVGSDVGDPLMAEALVGIEEG